MTCNIQYALGKDGRLDQAGKIRSARIDEDAPGSDHQPYWFELDF